MAQSRVKFNEYLTEYTASENIIGAPKMPNKYGTLNN